MPRVKGFLEDPRLRKQVYESLVREGLVRSRFAGPVQAYDLGFSVQVYESLVREGLVRNRLAGRGGGAADVGPSAGRGGGRRAPAGGPARPRAARPPRTRVFRGAGAEDGRGGGAGDDLNLDPDAEREGEGDDSGAASDASGGDRTFCALCVQGTLLVTAVLYVVKRFRHEPKQAITTVWWMPCSLGDGLRLVTLYPKGFCWGRRPGRGVQRRPRVWGGGGRRSAGPTRCAVFPSSFALLKSSICDVVSTRAKALSELSLGLQADRARRGRRATSAASAGARRRRLLKPGRAVLRVRPYLADPQTSLYSFCAKWHGVL